MRPSTLTGSAFAVLTLALGFTSPASLGGAAQRVKITVAQAFVAPFAIGVWIAGAHGLFAKNGLDVDLTVVDSTQAMEALLGGSVQVVLGSPDQGLAADAVGADVIAIATLAPRMAYWVVGRGISRPEDLRGKRLGMSGPDLSIDRAAMVIYLRSIGLNPRENTFITTGAPAQRLVAAATGTIDATVIDPARWLAADLAGLSLIADLTAARIPWDHAVVQTTRTYLNTHRRIVREFVRSLVEANAFILRSANKTAVIETLAGSLQIDRAQTGNLELNYQLTTKLYTVKKPYPSLEAAQTLIENLKADFPDLARVRAERYVERAIVKALDESGDVDRLYK